MFHVDDAVMHQVRATIGRRQEKIDFTHKMLDEYHYQKRIAQARCLQARVRPEVLANGIDIARYELPHLKKKIQMAEALGYEDTYLNLPLLKYRSEHRWLAVAIITYWTLNCNITNKIVYMNNKSRSFRIITRQEPSKTLNNKQLQESTHTFTVMSSMLELVAGHHAEFCQAYGIPASVDNDVDHHPTASSVVTISDDDSAPHTTEDSPICNKNGNPPVKVKGSDDVPPKEYLCVVA